MPHFLKKKKKSRCLFFSFLLIVVFLSWKFWVLIRRKGNNNNLNKIKKLFFLYEAFERKWREKRGLVARGDHGQMPAALICRSGKFNGGARGMCGHLIRSPSTKPPSLFTFPLPTEIYTLVQWCKNKLRTGVLLKTN